MLRIAWLHANGIDDWWGHAHDAGRIAVRERFGSAVDAVSVSDLGEGDEWAATARSLAESGTEVMFVCDTAVQRHVAALATEFPRTLFVHCQGTQLAPNIANFRAARDHHAYVSGMLAGAATRTGILGAVEGVRSPHDLVFTNAWVRGVRATRPDAVVHGLWVGSYRADDQAERERSAVAVLTALGADVIGGNLTENPNVVAEALAAGTRVSAHDDRLRHLPGVIDAAFLDWRPYCVEVVGRLLRNEPVHRDRYLRSADGVVRNSRPAAWIPHSAAADAAAVAADLRMGTCTIWSGPLRDSLGTVRASAGSSLGGTYAEPEDGLSAQEKYLNSNEFDWLVEGLVDVT